MACPGDIVVYPMNATPEQQAVIDHRQGHALVSAVAGSGKTDVLVARTKVMLSEGVDPDSMLILMFNKSAQEVFLERLADGHDEETSLPSVLTFHALGLRILDIWYDRKRVPVPELVDSEGEWMQLLAQVVDTQNRVAQAGINGHPDHLRKILAGFDTLKNMDYPYVTPDWELLGWPSNLRESIQALFGEFERERRQQRIMGLNDLLYDAVLLLRRESEYAGEWRESLHHIMVDEYQDSNPLQHWIVDQLLHEDSSLMVVGDEDQCIYTWRAADPDMMVRGFEARYKNVRRYMLSRTFRYGHAVALMANHVLQHNKVRPDKLVVSGLDKAGNIEVVRGKSSLALLPALRALTVDDAILVREFRHAEDIELVMHYYGLPYRMEGAPLFPARQTGLVLRMSLGCALEKPYMPTPEQARAWIRWVDPDASSLFVDYLVDDMTILGVERGIRNAMARENLPMRQQNHLVQMLVFNGRLRDAFTQKDPMGSIQRRMEDAWSRAVEKADDRKPAPLGLGMLELFATRTMEDVVAFLQDWEPDATGPILTSIHRAKGGGWPTVVLPHTEAIRFPTEVSEEERRLFYVAITRAKEQLILLVPQEDAVRDALWRQPANADLDGYKGPTGRFTLESYPEYALNMARTWLSTGKPSMDILTPTARRYEAVLYPNVMKSAGIWDKLNFL